MFQKVKIKITELRKVFHYSVLSIKLVSHGNKYLFPIVMINRVLVVVIPLANAYLYKEIIDSLVQSIQHKHVLLSSLYFLFFLRFLSYFFQTFLSSIDNFLTKQVHKISTKEFENALHQKLVSLDVQLFEDPDMKDMFDKVTENRWRTSYYVDLICSMLQSIVQVVLSLVGIMFIIPLLALIIVIISIPSLFIDMDYSKLSWSIWKANRHTRKKYWYYSNLLYKQEASKELHLLQIGQKIASDAYMIQNDFFKDDVQLAKQTFWKNIPLIVVNSVFLVCVEMFTVTRAIAGAISIGSLSYINFVIFQFMGGFTSLVKNFSELYDYTLYMESNFDLLAVKNVILEKENAVKLDPTKPHTIEFKDITFRYPNTSTDIFSHFTLTINAGERVAFVGENGAGKTTLVKLLVRFYDVDEGEILIDGINIKDINLDSWYRCVGILFQEFLRYQMSVKENIEVGKIYEKEETLKGIIEASKQAGAHPFIDKYEDKYDQLLGTIYDGSKDPSGGQWQKIALARGFLRDAPILVLDEPTAAIDAKAEFEIFKKIEELQSDKTVIIISHRFSTVRNAQKIYVLENGKIKEAGTHTSLMGINGTYAKLFNLQAAGYK